MPRIEMPNALSRVQSAEPPQAQAIHEYVTGFGRRFLYRDVLEKYPETKIIPPFLRAHFADATTVLDLGFGTAIWFWASFLPALQRIDGIELYPEALAEADRVLQLAAVPTGYVAAHRALGEDFTFIQFRALQSKRGALLIGDILKPWSPLITNTKYDLVTEYGGLGEAKTESQFFEIIRHAARVLRPGGSLLFVNFTEKQITPVEQKLGVSTPAVPQHTGLFARAAAQAGLNLAEFYETPDPQGMSNIQAFLYGFATKPT